MEPTSSSRCTAPILTNVEPDLLDHYGSFDDIVDGFDRYLAQIPGPKVVCADDHVCAGLAADHDVITYGLAESADYRGVEVRSDRGSFLFAVERRGERAR